MMSSQYGPYAQGCTRATMISEGISLGVISYVLLNLATGKGKKVAPLMYVLAVLFVLKYIFL